jgi:glycosyltransferase involved in cell wall biosynthesis
MKPRVSVSAIKAVRAELLSSDRLAVVADNCSDDTAADRSQSGAEVFLRNDATARGKSYALDFGIKRLAVEPPDVVIVVDADCSVHAGAP